ALGELVGARDAVHDHRVRRRADRRGIAPIPLERRDPALRADELLRQLVELLCRHTRTNVLAEQLECLDDNAAGALHLLDLVRILADDHATTTCSRACWISANTSSTLRSP